MNSVLRNGARSEEVKKLQTALNSKLKLQPPLKVDGVFGNGTEGAVKKFQTANNLQVDGVVGSKTWALLLKPAAGNNKVSVFLNTVIKPVVARLGGGTAAEELLLGTAMQESMCLKYRRQMRNGPARSYFQMEPATHNDIWKNYLVYRKKLTADVTSYLSSPTANKIDELEHNDKYAAAMARVQYMRAPAALPAQGDVKAQANYWKRYYNTLLGKGNPNEYIQKWNRCVLGGKP